jgi:hypothetical protein
MDNNRFNALIEPFKADLSNHGVMEGRLLQCDISCIESGLWLSRVVGAMSAGMRQHIDVQLGDIDLDVEFLKRGDRGVYSPAGLSNHPNFTATTLMPGAPSIPRRSLYLV